MIGHYLATLTPEQEDRVLTRGLAKGSYAYAYPDGSACLVGAVHAVVMQNQAFKLAHCSYWPLGPSGPSKSVEDTFDTLCVRFGTVRIANAIRARILANRAWRVLHAPALAEAAL